MGRIVPNLSGITTSGALITKVEAYAKYLTALYLDRTLEMKFLYSFLRVTPHILIAPLDRTLEIFFERNA